jgi:hypothetical protein
VRRLDTNNGLTRHSDINSGMARSLVSISCAGVALGARDTEIAARPSIRFADLHAIMEASKEFADAQPL